jgi:hypothetical protein
MDVGTWNTHIFQLNNIPKYFSPEREGGAKAGLAMLNELKIYFAVPFLIPASS